MPGAVVTLPQPGPTGQPREDLTRQAQYGKAFVYSFSRLVTAAGVGLTDTLTVDGGVQAFLVRKLAVLATNYGVKAQIKLSPNGEEFFDLPTFLTHLGIGRFPLVLPAPWVFRRNATVQAIFDDRVTGGLEQTVRLALIGEKRYDAPLVTARRYLARKAYLYSGNFTSDDGGLGPLAANRSRSFTAIVDGDSDFEVHKLTVASDGPVTVQVFFGSDTLFDTELRSELLGGTAIETPAWNTGEQPHILATPRLMLGGGSIRTVVSNQIAANNRVEVKLHGQRLYPAGGR